eukprot:15569087-Heterocapsa_arctica.AAC.1
MEGFRQLGRDRGGGHAGQLWPRGMGSECQLRQGVVGAPGLEIVVMSMNRVETCTGKCTMIMSWMLAL